MSNQTNNLNETNIDEIKNLDEILNIMRLICGKIVTPFICTIGFMANILNIIILTRSWMSSSTNIYLTAVSICDLLYLLFTFLFSLWIYPQLHQIKLFAYCITFIHGTANLFSNTTTFLTVGFTLERLIVISSPMIGKRFCTKKRAHYVVSSIFLFSFLFTLPDYLKRFVNCETINYSDDKNHQENNKNNHSKISYINTYSNSSQFTCVVMETRFYSFLTKIGYDYINQILFVIIPMILLIIFNSLLIKSVLNANKNRRTLTRQYSSNDMKNYSIKSTNISAANTATTVNTLNNEVNTNVVSTNTNNNNNNNNCTNSNLNTMNRDTIIIKEALEASMRTTIELASTITQSFRTKETQQFMPTSINTKRNKLGEQHRITLMLISIVMAFVILQLPSMVPTITYNLWNVGLLKSTIYFKKCLQIYSNISNVLLIINAAMNFVFYSLFSAKFRRTCGMLFNKFTCFRNV